ncbi:MAG: hypothetical protein QM487_05435 [Candidatus Marithrix sp.]
MDNFSSNNDQHSKKCQDCIHKHENIRLKEESQMDRMYANFNGEDISSLEDYLQDIENQYAHN